MAAPGASCDALHPFFDGELPPEEAERFRAHLPGCTACQAELGQLLQLEAAGAQLKASPEAVASIAGRDPPAKPRPRPVWRRLAIGGGALAAAAAALVVALPRGASDPYGLGASRPLEARLTHEGAREYRPYETVRSASSLPPLSVSLAGLAKMEERGDLQGVATGHLLRGERDQAAQLLARAGDSPAVKSDLAVAALQRGAAEEALALTDQALRAAPGHPQATWNRGLVLRELGLPLAAAEAFDEVVKLREPGWAEEAKRRAEGLAAEYERSAAASKAAAGLAQALIARGELPPAESVRRFPGLWRRTLYDAVRAAPSADRVRALTPLARSLDEAAGGAALHSLVDAVAAADFHVRAPLAHGYLALVTGTLTPAAHAELDRGTQTAGQPDLRLGVLLFTHAAAAHLDEARKLARDSADPFLELAVEEQAGEALVRDEPVEAERVLLSALARARRRKLDDRTGPLELLLAQLYGAVGRTGEAWLHAQAALRLARQTESWPRQLRALGFLGPLARQRGAAALARAYLREQELRAPSDCALQAAARAELAEVSLDERRPDEARAALERPAECAGEHSLRAALALADLAQRAPRAGDAERLEQSLAAVRAQGNLTGGETALVTAVEGRLADRSDPARAAQLFRAAIDAAAKLPAIDEPAARAREIAYASLALDAGRAGQWAQAVALLAEESRAAAPTRCAAAFASDGARTLAAVIGAKGDAVGALGEGVAAALARPQLDALAGCAVVDVLANGPLQKQKLLPPELAWRVRASRTEAPTATGGARAAERRVVIADAEPPDALGFPKLPAWSSANNAGALELRGAAATPRAALQAMRDATDIELHATALAGLAVPDASLVALSPDADGAWALGAREVRGHKLAGAPIVTLAGMRAGSGGDEWTLPVAFVQAGARAVLTAPADAPEAQARAFFDAVRARMAGGAEPAVALRDERVARRTAPGGSWVDGVLLFQ